ncbi:MAG: PAS domain S-box protein [Ignavibacteriaceae bacterium]
MIDENINSPEIELISKNANEEFIPDENQFRKLIENAPDGIAIVGTDGKFKYVSPSAKKIFGYDSEAELVIDPNEATHPDDLINVIKTLEALFVNPSLVLTLQYRFRHKNGEWLWIESTFSAVLNEAEIEGFIINFRSVEERKRIEAELVKKETLYRTLFDLSPAGIMLEDMYGNIIDINDTYLAITGYRREELVGHNVRKIVPPEYMDEVDKNIARIRSGETLIYEISTLRKDGTKNEIELRETLITLPNGEKGIIVVSNDISERKRGEEILRESEKKYRTIFENVQDAYYETSLEGIILSVSPSIELISGGQYHQADLIGRSMNDFYTDTEQRKHILSLLQQKGSVTDHEVYFKNKDGLPISCSISAKLYFDAQGHPEKIIGSLRNITDRKVAEEKLKKSEARLLYAQRVGHIGNWDWDIQSNELFWSEECKSIFGLTPDDQVTVKGFLESVAPDDIEFVKKSIDDALSQKKPYDIEMRLIRPDGLKRVVHAVAEVSFDETGNPVRMFGTMQDITERKKAETKIRFQSNMLNTIGQAVVSTDLQGNITYWNKAAEIIYGWTANEAMGHYVIDIIPSTASESQTQEIMKNLNERKAWSGEFSVKRKDGNLFPVFATTSPVLNDYGELIGIIATSIDITERTNHLKMIEESSKQLRALSLKIEDLREEERTAIARELHDELGQLLTAIKIDLQSIANHPPNKKETSKQIKPVVDLVEESILSIRKLSSDLRPTILDHLGLVSAMQWYIAEQKKRLKTDITFKIPSAIGKISKKKTIPVFRVFQELLTNIARHAQATKVKIKIEIVDSTMKLIVSDNGVGMNTDYVDNIKSLGILGMKERLSAIGGSLEYSNTPGSGTTAEVLVPLIHSDEIV